jgi:putative oxidoreductase
VSSNPIYAFFSTPKSFGPFILRMLLAAVFFYHGSQKAFGLFGGPGWNGTMEAFAGMGFSSGTTALVMLTELLVSLSMFFGFLTRLASLGVIALMAGALWFVHGAHGISECEYPFALLVVALGLMFIGAGRLSLDRAISSQLLPSVGGY